MLLVSFRKPFSFSLKDGRQEALPDPRQPPLQAPVCSSVLIHLLLRRQVRLRPPWRGPRLHRPPPPRAEGEGRGGVPGGAAGGNCGGLLRDWTVMTCATVLLIKYLHENITCSQSVLETGSFAILCYSMKVDQGILSVQSISIPCSSEQNITHNHKIIL